MPELVVPHNGKVVAFFKGSVKKGSVKQLPTKRVQVADPKHHRTYMRAQHVRLTPEEREAEAHGRTASTVVRTVETGEFFRLSSARRPLLQLVNDLIPETRTAVRMVLKQMHVNPDYIRDLSQQAHVLLLQPKGVLEKYQERTQGATAEKPTRQNFRKFYLAMLINGLRDYVREQHVEGIHRIPGKKGKPALTVREAGRGTAEEAEQVEFLQRWERRATGVTGLEVRTEGKIRKTPKGVLVVEPGTAPGPVKMWREKVLAERGVAVPEVRGGTRVELVEKPPSSVARQPETLEAARARAEVEIHQKIALELDAAETAAMEAKADVRRAVERHATMRAAFLSDPTSERLDELEVAERTEKEAVQVAEGRARVPGMIRAHWTRGRVRAAIEQAATPRKGVSELAAVPALEKPVERKLVGKVGEPKHYVTTEARPLAPTRRQPEKVVPGHYREVRPAHDDVPAEYLFVPLEPLKVVTKEGEEREFISRTRPKVIKLKVLEREAPLPPYVPSVPPGTSVGGVRLVGAFAPTSHRAEMKELADWYGLHMRELFREHLLGEAPEEVSQSGQPGRVQREARITPERRKELVEAKSALAARTDLSEAARRFHADWIDRKLAHDEYARREGVPAPEHEGAVGHALARRLGRLAAWERHLIDNHLEDLLASGKEQDERAKMLDESVYRAIGGEAPSFWSARRQALAKKARSFFGDPMKESKKGAHGKTQPSPVQQKMVAAYRVFQATRPLAPPAPTFSREAVAAARVQSQEAQERLVAARASRVLPGLRAEAARPPIDVPASQAASRAIHEREVAEHQKSPQRVLGVAPSAIVVHVAVPSAAATRRLAAARGAGVRPTLAKPPVPKTSSLREAKPVRYKGGVRQLSKADADLQHEWARYVAQAISPEVCIVERDDD